MLKRLLIIINGFLLLLLILGFLTPYISANYGSYFPLISLLFPFILLANIAFIFCWLLIKPSYALGPFLIILLGYKHIPKHLHLTNAAEKTECSKLSIVSQNLQAAKYFKKNKRTLDKHKSEEFGAWIKTLGPIDIFCFQEQRYHANQLLKEHLSSLNIHSVDTIGTGIYSSYPFVDKGFVSLGGNTKYAAWADIKIKQDTLRVYSVHLSSNMISSKAKTVLDEHDLRKSGTWSNINSIIQRYGKYSLQRKSQWDKLEKHINTTKHKVIIAGDFNDVPQSYLYKKLSSKFKDSFKVGEAGIGTTYKEIPGLRIDYFFSNESVHLLNHKVLNQSFSDHYPIKLEFCLNN